MQALLAFTHALADETRLRLLHLVAGEALCVCELADILDMPQSSVSSHVQVIRQAGLLASERCEKWIYYRLEPKFAVLLTTLGKSFSVSPATDATLKADAKRARTRLAEREQSCCPGPKKLALKPLRRSRLSLSKK